MAEPVIKIRATHLIRLIRRLIVSPKEVASAYSRPIQLPRLSVNGLQQPDEFTGGLLRFCEQVADSDEAAPLFRDDCAPGFRDDLAPC
ncbi:hypothetical protein GOB17_23950, partial [Sinorhizobium meliloti]|nr:hypothetical protein [Sinorhizobium meliloti]